MDTVQNEMFDWLCMTFGFNPGVDAFENRLPSTNQTGQEMPTMWLVGNDNFVVRQFASKTKEKEYSLLLHYRAPKAETVNQKIMEIEQAINHLSCFDLPSYRVKSIQASSFNAAEDADSENFWRGSVTIRLSIIDTYS